MIDIIFFLIQYQKITKSLYTIRGKDMYGDFIMKKKERIYLKEVDSIQQHMQKMINKCNDAIKEYSEDNIEWQKISGCKSPYNLNLKLDKMKKNQEVLKAEIEEWRKISGCNSPYNLNLKLNRINNLNAKKELQTQLQKRRFDIFDKYCVWVKENNLFDIFKTYVMIFDIFQNEKEKAIELIETKQIDKQDNHWFIVDFLIYLVDNNIDDPDIRLSNVKNKINDLKVNFVDFDVYDQKDIWYNNQTPTIQSIIKENKKEE